MGLMGLGTRVFLNPVFRTRTRTLPLSLSYSGHHRLLQINSLTLKSPIDSKNNGNNDLALSSPVTQVQPITFSPTVRQKLSHSRLAWIQRVYQETQNPFLADVGEARDVYGVLDMVERHAHNLSPREVGIALEIIFNFVKDEQSSTRKKELSNSVGMQKLWKLVRKKTRSMLGPDLIGVVKTMSVLEVSGMDTTLQIVLKVLTKHANSLDLNEIMYLHFLLSRSKPEFTTPLSSALEVALPVVFESQIATQASTGELNHSSLQSLCDYLHYAARQRLNETTVQSIMSALDKQTAPLTPRMAMSLLWSIADLPFTEAYQVDVLKRAYRVAAQHIESYDLNTISTAIAKACKKYANGNKASVLYDEDFLQAFCRRALSIGNKTADRDHVLYSFKYLQTMRHVNVEYMDLVGELVAAHPSEFLNNDILFASLLRSFAGFNYKPETWSKIEALFLNHPALTKELGSQSISLTADFLTLDMYPEALVHRVFSPEALPQLDFFIQRNPFNSAYVLLLILNAVQTLYPQYSGSLPPLSMINKWKELAVERSKRDLHPIKSALQAGFGGENYVLNGLFHSGIYIDHAVVMRKGGYPIAMNAMNNLELSEIPKPSEGDIVLVKLFWKEAYANNTPRLRGLQALEQRILEKLGNPLLVVDVNRWTELPDFEKIPYLMHRIREKTEKLHWNSNDVIP